MVFLLIDCFGSFGQAFEQYFLCGNGIILTYDSLDGVHAHPFDQAHKTV
jgi:hypothetical protein